MYSQAAYYIPAVLSFFFVYSVTFGWIFKKWFTYQGAHGPVILTISLYIIWTQKERLKKLRVSPNFAFGMPITALGCLMLVSGRFAGVLLLQQLSLIVTLLGLVWFLLGTSHMKALWYPVSYLIFMFPIFSEILERFSIHFQNAAAWIAYSILNLTGTPVLRYGQFIELPNITLEVARECNGVNHIIALVSLAIVLAYWTQRTAAGKALLVAFAFLLGIAANGLRVAIIGILAIYNKGGEVHGPYDIFYVSFIFFFGMVVLIAVSAVIGRRGAGETTDDEAGMEEAGSRQNGRLRLPALVAATAFLLLTGAYLVMFKPRPVYLNRPFAAFPVSVGSWSGRDTSFTEAPFKYFSADTELKRVYRDPAGREISLYIGYFALQGQDREVVNYRFDPLHRNAETMKIDVDGGPIEVKRGVMDTGMVNYFWYDINGRILAGRYSAEIRTVLEAVTRSRTNAAIIVVSAAKGANEKSDIDFIKKAFPVIRSYLRN